MSEKKRDISVHTRQMEKLKNKLRNLINMRAEGEISKEDFAEMKAGLEEEIKALSNEIEKNCALITVKKGGIFIIESRDPE